MLLFVCESKEIVGPLLTGKNTSTVVHRHTYRSVHIRTAAVCFWINILTHWGRSVKHSSYGSRFTIAAPLKRGSLWSIAWAMPDRYRLVRKIINEQQNSTPPPTNTTWIGWIFSGKLKKKEARQKYKMTLCTEDTEWHENPCHSYAYHSICL